ncbi:MAG: electron transfer flavoprotein subunit alpha/FixB family protein, partial [Clostridiales bacterium]|nr:electron transfer flavoprotein subunit alpha/FixB family protein [Clostridiales bacterium]
MNNILIVAEQYHGKTASVSLELLGIARELAGVDGHVSAALCGYGINKQAEQLAGYGADTVYAADGGVFSRYNTECFSKAVYKAVKAADPDIVLFGATSVGRDLAPRLSAKLGTGLTADCTKLEIGEDGGLLMTRPAFGGNL